MQRSFFLSFFLWAECNVALQRGLSNVPCSLEKSTRNGAKRRERWRNGAKVSETARTDAKATRNGANRREGDAKRRETTRKSGEARRNGAIRQNLTVTTQRSRARSAPGGQTVMPGHFFLASLSGDAEMQTDTVTWCRVHTVLHADVRANTLLGNLF